MNVSLTPNLEKWIQEKVSTGMYSSSSEVVREALRMLAQYEKSQQEKLDSLKTDILLGVSQVDMGNVVVFDETELSTIKSEARASF